MLWLTASRVARSHHAQVPSVMAQEPAGGRGILLCCREFVGFSSAWGGGSCSTQLLPAQARKRLPTSFPSSVIDEARVLPLATTVLGWDTLEVMLINSCSCEVHYLSTQNTFISSLSRIPAPRTHRHATGSQWVNCFNDLNNNR